MSQNYPWVKFLPIAKRVSYITTDIYGTEKEKGGGERRGRQEWEGGRETEKEEERDKYEYTLIWDLLLTINLYYTSSL